MSVAGSMARLLRRVLGTDQLIDQQRFLANQVHRIQAFLNVKCYYDVAESILKTQRYQEDKRLLKYGFKVYSQADEDGIIQAIFRRIGTKSKTFFEIGIGDGLENNTLALLVDGWKGVWINGNSDNKISIEKKFCSLISDNQLTYSCKFVNCDNINSIISEYSLSGEVDFFSIDIDGNDYHVFENIKDFCPRVVAIEYNAKFRHPTKWCMKYNPQHFWDGSDYYGASLSSLEGLLARRGYRLVGCNLAGVNAFFVREDLVRDLFCGPFTAENHYEPARYWLSHGYPPSGHPANFGAFERLD